MRRLAILVLLAATLALCAGACLADGSAGGTLAQWKQHRDAVLRDPKLLRLYTFEGVREGAPVPNLAGAEGALDLNVVPLARAPEEKLTVIEGRWPGKTAVRVDRGVFSAPAFAVGEGGFTVEMWFRKNGYGAMRGNGGSTNGTLLSIGGGYWDGFRVTTSYPEQTFGFEIGRPQPSSSVGFGGVGPLPDGMWHHLAATWDGKESRLYLDGALAGSTKYDGAFTPAARFQIGYADAGWGSTKLDVDEVAVYEGALPEADVLSHSIPAAPVTAGVLAAFKAAADARRAGNWSAALAPYRSTSENASLAADVRAFALLRVAECSRKLGKGGDATRAYERVCTMPGVADRFRASALLALAGSIQSGADLVSMDTLKRIAASPGVALRDRLAARLALATRLRRSGNGAAADRIEAELMKDESLSSSDRLGMALAAGHALRAAGRHAAARAQYGRVAALPGAPAEMKTYCALLSAHTYAAEHKLAAARNAYRALLKTPDLPSSHRLEAEESLREATRLLAGKPAHDPMDTRVQLPAFPKPGAELFVAPDGSDSNPGTRSKPLATLAGAIRAVRALKKPAGGVAVTFRGGTYRMADTATLTAEDSGTVKSPIVYRAAPGEGVRFWGGAAVGEMKPVTDAAALARIPEEARGKVLCADLKAAGIADLGEMAPRGVGAAPTPVVGLYAGDQPLDLARWPNKGWATTGTIVEEKTASGGFAFQYDGDRPARWTAAKDGWLLGYFGWLWADGGVAIASIDTAAHRIATRQGSSYGAREGMPYFAYNLLEELDAPGEWYLDRESGMLYVIPPAGWGSRSGRPVTMELSMLAKPFLSLKGASHVRFERLAFDCGRADGAVIEGSDHVLLAGCTISRLGGVGVTVKGGSNCGVFGCNIYALGRNGTSITGGDRKTLKPGGHFVENCHIHDFSRWDRTYTPAVFADGVGIRIAHNLIHDTPGHAMRIEGNDHLIGWNEVHDAVYETDDQGALDMWFNPTYRGVVIRDNYWHHIGDGKDQRMRAGIRLDDAISGVLIYGNVFQKAAEGYFGGLQIHGGKENVVDNNLFLDCKYGISFSRWGAERWRQYVKTPEFVKATTEAVDIANPPYSTRYPALAHLADDPDVNLVWRNVAANCGEFLTRDGGVERTMDNLTLGGDPGFVGAGKRDYTLKPDSPVFAQSGFRPIAFGDIGLYPHPLRASWPVKHAVGTHGVK